MHFWIHIEFKKIIGQFKQNDICKFIHITRKCVLVHSGFHYILSEFGHFLPSEIVLSPSEQGLVVIDNDLFH
jgi:hypothetical protein